MTNLLKNGIYSGGQVTKVPDSDGDKLLISEYLLNPFVKTPTGSGESGIPDVSKFIQLRFNMSVNSPDIFRAPLSAPQYNINIANNAGAAWIIYNESINDMDIVMTAPNPTPGVFSKVVFAKIVWDAPSGSYATNLDRVSIDYSDRTEARMITTVNPQNPKNLYHDSQRFVSGTLNEPLANLAVLMEVLQGETLVRIGGSYFLTLATANQIVKLPNGNVRLQPCKHLVRDAITDMYRIYYTKEDEINAGAGYAMKHDFTVAEIDDLVINPQKIYIVVDKEEGYPSVLIGDPQISDKHIIAVSTQAVDDPADAVYEVVNDLANFNKIREEVSLVFSNNYTNGFLRPVSIEETSTPNVVRLKENVVLVRGISVLIPEQNITLNAPSVNGSRQDFIFLEIERFADPVIRLSAEIRVASNFNYQAYKNPFLNTTIVRNSANNAFTPSTEHPNLYIATKTGNLDGVTYGLPIAIIPRFNSSGYTDANLNGGTSRPDGKTATSIHSDEIFCIGPMLNRKDKNQLIGDNLELLLKGELLTNLEQATYAEGPTGSYSKKPLMIDYLGASSPGVQIGRTNNARRLWSHNIDKQEFYGFRFNTGDTDFNAAGGIGSFLSSISQATLTIKVTPPLNPSIQESQLIIDPFTGQPANVSIKWVNNGQDVVLSGIWTVGQDYEIASVLIDKNAGSYQAAGDIAVIFPVKYLKAEGLSKVPLEIISCQRNNASGLANSYAVAPNVSTVPTFHKNLEGAGNIVTIGGETYLNSLYTYALGDVGKYYTYQMSYHLSGQNLSTPYAIPRQVSIGSESYEVIGVIEVENKDNVSLPVSDVRWYNGTDTIEVRLGTAVTSTEPVIFRLAVAGRQLDINPGSLEISNLSETSMVQGTVPAGGIIRYCSGNIVFGFHSFRGLHKVFLEDYMVPVKIEGLNTNLVTIDLRISPAIYNDLPAGQKTFYGNVPETDGLYHPITNSAVRFCLIESLPTLDDIVFCYKYGASPFRSFDTTKKATIVHRGFLIQSTDGTANGSGGIYSPISERFPVVQNIDVVGIYDPDIPPSPLGIWDVLNYQQNRIMFIEGREIKLEGSYSLATQVKPKTGLAVWACLIEQENNILLFIYQVRDGLFILNNPAQAFVCELKDFRRESVWL